MKKAGSRVGPLLQDAFHHPGAGSLGQGLEFVQ